MQPQFVRLDEELRAVCELNTVRFLLHVETRRRSDYLVVQVRVARQSGRAQRRARLEVLIVKRCRPQTSCTNGSDLLNTVAHELHCVTLAKYRVLKDLHKLTI